MINVMINCSFILNHFYLEKKHYWHFKKVKIQPFVIYEKNMLQIFCAIYSNAFYALSHSNRCFLS